MLGNLRLHTAPLWTRYQVHILHVRQDVISVSVLVKRYVLYSSTYDISAVEVMQVIEMSEKFWLAM